MFSQVVTKEAFLAASRKAEAIWVKQMPSVPRCEYIDFLREEGTGATSTVGARYAIAQQYLVIRERTYQGQAEKLEE